jgi:hypothetical protein
VTIAAVRRPTYLAAWTLIALVIALSAIDLIVRGATVSPDAVSYLSMAEGLRQFEFTHWSGAPTGLWPYGYPAVLALLGGRARAMIESGFVVQLAALAGVASYLILIARRRCSDRPSAPYLIGAAGMLASPAILAAAQWLESELLFTFVWVAFVYHIVIQGLLRRDAPGRRDLVAGTVAAFLLPNFRYIGVAAPLGLAVGAVVLTLLGDADRRLLVRRASAPIVGGFVGMAVAMLINLTTAHTMFGERPPQVDVLRSAILHSVATFFEVLVGPHRLPRDRYEIAPGLVVAIVLVLLTVRTVRAAWGAGGDEYRRFTVWTLTGIGSYLAILYWSEFTMLLDAISPRLLLPVLPSFVMWLIYSYVVASGTGQLGNVLRFDRFAGWLAVALWLGSFVWSVTDDLAQPAREGDLGVMRLGSQDRACLARIADAPVGTRISNNAALVWLGTEGGLTAKQASYEAKSPNDFYFIDTRADAVGPEEVLAGTTSRVLCSGEHLVVEQRTRSSGDQP